MQTFDHSCELECNYFSEVRNNKRFSAVHHPRRKAQGRSFVMVFSLVKIKRNLKKYKSLVSTFLNGFPCAVLFIVQCQAIMCSLLPLETGGEKITDGYMKVDENCICTVCVYVLLKGHKV